MHASQSLLKSLATATPDRLTALYSEVSNIEPELIRNSLLIDNDNPLAKIRWMCVFPIQPILTVTPDELVAGLRVASVEELSTLLPRLSKCPMIGSERYLFAMREAVSETTSDADAIRISSLLAEIDSQWDQWTRVAAKIARGLMHCPASESLNWSRSLRKIKAVLLREVFKRENHSDAPAANIDRNSDFSDAKRSHGYLDSEAMRTILWQWVSESDEHFVDFVESTPTAHLGMIAFLSPELRAKVVAGLHQRWQALKEELQLLQKPHTITTGSKGFWRAMAGSLPIGEVLCWQLLARKPPI